MKMSVTSCVEIAIMFHWFPHTGLPMCQFTGQIFTHHTTSSAEKIFFPPFLNHLDTGVDVILGGAQRSVRDVYAAIYNVLVGSVFVCT